MVLVDLTGRMEAESHVVINNFRHIFRKNEYGDKVCDVLSGEHVNWLLRSGNFKEYVPPDPRRNPLTFYVTPRTAPERYPSVEPKQWKAARTRKIRARIKEQEDEQ